MSIETEGKRIDGKWDILAPGEYGMKEGLWYACTPNGLLANLGNHEIEVSPEGELSVRPSILVKGWDKQWHGYLQYGRWIEC